MLAKNLAYTIVSQEKNSITRGLGKKILPNHITHIPASKLKWSAPEVDSLRVKTNLILKGYMASESKDAVFKKWRRLTSQDRVLSPV